jgi:hypothetical protein
MPERTVGFIQRLPRPESAYRCNEIVGADVIFVRGPTRISNEIGRRSALRDRTMDTNETTTRIGQGREARSRCLVDGCPCQDARIVSHRRARFFAHLAETHGETAQRVISPEPDWELPRPA